MRAWLAMIVALLLWGSPNVAAQAPLEIDILEGYLATHDNAPMLSHCARHDGTLFTPNGPVTVPGGGTNDVLRQHKDWHLEYEGAPGSQDDPSDSNRFGDHFVFWHREFIGAYEAWRLESGHPTLPAWDPSTPIPANLAYDFPGRGCSPGRNNDPAVPLPTWATLEGGSHGDPIFGHTALCEFQDINQFGKALAIDYHPSVHRELGGDMSAGQGPRDPVFWAYHRYLDDISLAYESECPLGGLGASTLDAPRGIPGSGAIVALGAIAAATLVARESRRSS